VVNSHPAPRFGRDKTMLAEAVGAGHGLMWTSYFLS
jgi:hypothetical protein